MTGVPAGKTWFETLKKSFVDVPVNGDQGIDTSTFLEASEATTTLFDLLGSVAFTPVKNDMLGNVKKVRERQLASPGTSENLQDLCKAEIASKSHKATEGLLWLVRGLDFTAQALRNDLTNNAGVQITEAKPKKELADSFRDAYKNTLAPHHSFMVKPIFSAAMSATPYRKGLYAKMLGQGASPDTLSSEFEKWLSALESQDPGRKGSKRRFSLPYRGLQMQRELGAAATSTAQAEPVDGISETLDTESEGWARNLTKTDTSVNVEAVNPTAFDGVQDRELSPSEDPHNTAAIVIPTAFV